MVYVASGNSLHREGKANGRVLKGPVNKHFNSIEHFLKASNSDYHTPNKKDATWLANQEAIMYIIRH